MVVFVFFLFLFIYLFIHPLPVDHFVTKEEPKGPLSALGRISSTSVCLGRRLLRDEDVSLEYVVRYVWKANVGEGNVRNCRSDSLDGK